MSPRAKEPYIKVNCAAIPETLIESELFGFEKGAFTGAHRQTSGKFELADKGTLLLDEIGDMPVHVQPKLLRVVEEKQVERLGGGRSVDVDVRIISATHQDLPGLISDKKFREDLYYRLNIATIHMPPLRERKEDIPLLAEHFLEKIREGMNMSELGLTPEALQLLMQFDWPGNVRHLANALERAAINAVGSTITAGDVERTFSKPKAEALEPEMIRNASLRDTLIQVERNLIESALRRAGGRQTIAADFLGISPKNLWNKIQKHGIDPKEIKRQCGTPPDADD
jgi:two-component system response regulator AtoC